MTSLTLHEVLQQRKIQRLVHFTKSSNLPYILGNDNSCSGIMSTRMLNDESQNDMSNESNYRIQLDLNRYDNKDNCVCCSLQNINYKLFYARNKSKGHDELFNNWATLFIDPQVIDDDTYFSTTNAAARDAVTGTGVNSFNRLFSDHIVNKNKVIIRNPGLAANEPTDVQAEILIKGMIHKRSIIGIAFPRATFEIEKARLHFYAPNNHLPIYKMEDTCYRSDMINMYNDRRFIEKRTGQTFLNF